MKTKKSRRLTLHDRLSRLTFLQACQMLGPEGKRLIPQGSRFDGIDLRRDVSLSPEAFRVRLPFDGAVVTITMPAEARRRLRIACSACETACEHMGAALSLVLEEKTPLGLAAPPVERKPLESLGERELVQRALDERAERAREERFRLRSSDRKRPWTDYTVTSAASGKTYRVALRGTERGQSYCSCPDFRTNTLGTCKHVMYALERVRRRFSAAALRRKFRQREIIVHLLYGKELTLHLRLPDNAEPEVARIAGRLADGPVEDVPALVRTIGRLERAGHGVTVYPDAEQLIEQRLFQQRLADRVTEIRRDPAGHPLRRELLTTELLPYQLDGIAFAVGAGRAVLADDMGLGKTIQGIGVAELLAREAGIRKVLVVCPASLKSQWRNEIYRFSGRSVQLVIGGAAERAEQYDNEAFFTVCNYEQVLRDILAIERVPWDLIVLDEGQRIKNWASKTAGVIKGLRSPFALVLSGTPLENRLDELYSVVQFIDDRRLAPAFRFFNRHRMVDEKGKVLGYKNLDQLRERLRPILLRRTRGDVLEQLPPRSTEIVRIPPTDEQVSLHNAHMQIVSMIVRKPYISEMDLLRLQKSLLMCRLAANSTFLDDRQEPGYSTKLERLDDLIGRLFEEPNRKAVLFSEWTRMLDLIEPRLAGRKLDFVRLDGSVPQKKRQALVSRFQKDDDCRLFITTNAGSTGLNLQAANTVINVDLPWNPAVLEQRVARAHRMGQKSPVQVFVLVTEETIEENLLGTLAAKADLALAVLDPESDVSQVDMVSGIEEMRRRLEVLLGAAPEAPLDETQAAQTQSDAERSAARRERVAAAGGELLGAMFHFLDELVAERPDAPAPPQQVVAQVRNRLAECVEESPTGQQRLTLTLPDGQALDGVAQTLARLLVTGGE